MPLNLYYAEDGGAVIHHALLFGLQVLLVFCKLFGLFQKTLVPQRRFFLGKGDPWIFFQDPLGFFSDFLTTLDFRPRFTDHPGFSNLFHLPPWIFTLEKSQPLDYFIFEATLDVTPPQHRGHRLFLE